MDASPLAMAGLALLVEAGLNRVCQIVLWSSARWRGTEWPVRVVKWQYWFTTPEEKRRTSAWCRRQERGLYAPTLTLGPEGIQAVAMPPE